MRGSSTHSLIPGRRSLARFAIACASLELQTQSYSP